MKQPSQAKKKKKKGGKKVCSALLLFNPNIPLVPEEGKKLENLLGGEEGIISLLHSQILLLTPNIRKGGDQEKNRGGGGGAKGK